MANAKEQTQENKGDLKKKGKKALILNIIFFIVLLAGLLSIPLISFSASIIMISFIFVISIAYIYFT